MPVRHEYQPWNRVGVSLNIIVGGIAQAGLESTTHFLIRRRSDGLYWNDAGLVWDVSPPVSQPLLEQGPVFPGNYARAIGQVGLDYTLGQFGYDAVVSESRSGAYEHMRINVGPRRGGIWKDLVADAFDPGLDDMGNLMIRLIAVRQHNLRFVPSAWNATNKQPTAGLVLLYDNASDHAADVSPWPLAIGQYTVGASFDGFGQMTSYTSVKNR